jgi:hypothetical protein
MIATAEYNVPLRLRTVFGGRDTVQEGNSTTEKKGNWIRTIDLGADDEAIQKSLDRLAASQFDAADQLVALATPGITNAVRQRYAREKRLSSRYYSRADVAQDACVILLSALRGKSLGAQKPSNRPPSTIVQYERIIWASIGYAFLRAYRKYLGPEGPAAHHQSHHGKGSSTDASRWLEAQVADDATGAATEVEREERREQLVVSLPEQFREAFVLIQFAGLKAPAVAKIIQKDSTTVRRYYREALKLLESYDFGSGAVK